MPSEKASIFDKLYTTLTHQSNRNPLIYGGFAGCATFLAAFMMKGKVITPYLWGSGSYLTVFYSTQVYEKHEKVLEALRREQFRDFTRYDMLTRGTDVDEKPFEKPINFGRRF